MVKTQAIRFINSRLGAGILTTRNTNFANISISGTRAAWWLNIKLESFKKDWNIVLAGEDNFIWLKIPANTFINPEEYFRIWKAKNAVNLVVSCDRQDRYLKDVSSGAKEVDFKPFIVEKITIPEKMKISVENSYSEAKRKKPELITFTSVPQLKTETQKQWIIEQDETNISYETLFAGHLKGADKIVLQDPYIRLSHQFNNLLEFCVMLGNNKENATTVNLEVTSWNTKGYKDQSKKCFQELAASVKEMGINLSYRLKNIHDRFIEANNGNKIILGRGLDIFEKREGRFSIGDVDQKWRKCKACEITYIKF